MRPLSEQTRRLISELGSAPGNVGLIHRLAECGEGAAIPHLASALCVAGGVAANAAGYAIHRLVSNLEPEELPWLDEQMRGISFYTMLERWKMLAPGEVESLPQTEETKASILGLASLHANGRIREAAVRQLARITDGREVPFLLLRLNDWVTPVREMARFVLLGRLSDGHVEPFFENLFLVFRLSRCGREDHTQIVLAVTGALADPKHAATLIHLANHRSRFVRRRCFQHALTTDGEHRKDVVRCGLNSEDSVLRLWATRSVESSFDDSEIREILPNLKSDAFMPVRREALSIDIRLAPEAAVATLKEALLDGNIAIREFARFHLKKLGWTAFAPFYRDAIQQGRKLPTVISGLGESGSKGDVGTLLPFLSAGRAKERRAAVRSLAMLCEKDHAETLLAALDDPSKKVAREAMNALRGNGHWFDIEELWRLVKTGSRYYQRAGTLELLSEARAWKCFPYLVRAAADSDARIASLAENTMDRRYNSVYTKPSETELQHLHNAIAECQSRLKGPFLLNLQQWLNTRP